MRDDGLTTVEREELSRLRREIKTLAHGARDLKTSHGLVRQGSRLEPQEGFRVVRAHRTEYPISKMCRVLGVSPSGYYNWLDRLPSARAVADAALLERMKAHHKASRGTYGRPRLHEDLKEEGIKVGSKRVTRLMKKAGIMGVSRRRRRGLTKRDKNAHPIPDLVDRNFTADGPDQLRVADITYIPT
jgi:putative transposase